jgi:hypothetical protein
MRRNLEFNSPFQFLSSGVLSMMTCEKRGAMILAAEMVPAGGAVTVMISQLDRFA